MGGVVGTPVGWAVGAGGEEPDGAAVGIGGDVGAVPVGSWCGVTAHPEDAALAPARSHAVNAAVSADESRLRGGGGMGFASLAMRSAARLATVRLASLIAGRRKSDVVRSGIGTPNSSGGEWHGAQFD